MTDHVNSQCGKKSVSLALGVIMGGASNITDLTVTNSNSTASFFYTHSPSIDNLSS